MDSAHLFITRVAERHWHALDDDQVTGRGEVSRRPDGRLFLSIDAWHDAVFDRLAETLLADLPRPLYTVVDEADVDLLLQWERAGFAPRRREWEYALPTDPQRTGLGSAPPDGVRVLGAGAADEGRLRELDRVLRDEIEAGSGWQSMPAEVLCGPDGRRLPVDPSKYAVATRDGEYVGLVRITPLPRQPRIGLIAVRSGHRRRGIARALLAEVLGSAYRRGIASASADVHQSNRAAIALFEGLGARRTGSNLELVRHG